jgi:selenocysteine-specific elongation factor
VLDLLGVGRGVVVLTKTDLVSAEEQHQRADEIAEALIGTSLSGARILPVSVMDGTGLDELTAGLERLCAEVPDQEAGRPRLWIDRVFTSPGAGLIVTGSLIGGGLSVGDEVVVHPAADRARVRRIQSHDEDLDTVAPGRRVALNLTGVKREEVHRGDMIGIPGQHRSTTRILASYRLARYHKTLDKRGSYQLHVGSVDCSAVVTGVDEQHLVAQLGLALPLSAGDKYIIRDTGRGVVVAGGRVLDPWPGPTVRALASGPVLEAVSSPDEIATRLLELRRRATAFELTTDSGGGSPMEGDRIDELWLAPGALAQLRDRAVAVAEAFHERQPLREGIPLATLGAELGVDQDTAAVVVDGSPSLQRIGSFVSVGGREPQLGPEESAARDAIVMRLRQGLAVPTVRELGADTELIHLLIRRGELVRVGPDLVMLPDQVASIREIISGIETGFTVSDLRERTGLSRKYLIPILEWADAEGLTVRRGETRWPR